MIEQNFNAVLYKWMYHEKHYDNTIVEKIINYCDYSTSRKMWAKN